MTLGGITCAVPFIMPLLASVKAMQYVPHSLVPVRCSNNVETASLHLQEHYEKYDGFVILHGTDTMAYTASALSFMCENLGKTVVLTGSQVTDLIQS